MKVYTTPRLVAVMLDKSDAVRTSGTLAVSEKGYRDIFNGSASADEGGENE